MAPPVDEKKPESEYDRLEAWRLEQLIRAGWEYHRAELLAKRPEVDLHAAIDLVRSGCPQRLALRILL